MSLFLILLYKLSLLNTEALQKINPPAAAAKDDVFLFTRLKGYIF